jgi:hypothetical protein
MLLQQAYSVINYFLPVGAPSQKRISVLQPIEFTNAYLVFAGTQTMTYNNSQCL